MDLLNNIQNNINMFNAILELLVLADLIAIGLICCRDDRNEFFFLFINDFKERDFLQLFFLCLMTFCAIWVTIPWSIKHIKEQNNGTNI